MRKTTPVSIMIVAIILDPTFFSFKSIPPTITVKRVDNLKTAFGYATFVSENAVNAAY
jgi:hypothetical protein